MFNIDFGPDITPAFHQPSIFDMDFQVTDNKDQQQYEVTEDGQLAILKYRVQDDLTWLMHTEVPESLEGKGIASSLAKFAMEHAKATHSKVKVLCPFVSVFLKRHPEYNEFVQV